MKPLYKLGKYHNLDKLALFQESKKLLKLLIILFMIFFVTIDQIYD
jgi:hypothetical protein